METSPRLAEAAPVPLPPPAQEPAAPTSSGLPPAVTDSLVDADFASGGATSEAPAPRAFLQGPLDVLPPLEAGEPAVVEVRARPASLWRRAGALLLDAAIVLGVVALFLELALLVVPQGSVRGPYLTGLDGVVTRLHAVHGVLPLAAVLLALLAFVYSSVFAFLWGGRSPGRWLFGIRLVDRRGLAPLPGRAVARALLGLVSFALFLAGFWLSLFDRRGQTLHDKLTRTFVVRPG